MRVMFVFSPSPERTSAPRCIVPSLPLFPFLFAGLFSAAFSNNSLFLFRKFSSSCISSSRFFCSSPPLRFSYESLLREPIKPLISFFLPLDFLCRDAFDPVAKLVLEFLFFFFFLSFFFPNGFNRPMDDIFEFILCSPEMFFSIPDICLLKPFGSALAPNPSFFLCFFGKGEGFTDFL